MRLSTSCWNYSKSCSLNTVNSRLVDTWPVSTDTPIIRTAATSLTKINHRRLTEINSNYYGLSPLRTLTRVSRVSAIKGVDCIQKIYLRKRSCWFMVRLYLLLSQDVIKVSAFYPPTLQFIITNLQSE